MARMARVIVPGIPHHITQRGNRRLKTFFCAEDYQTYINLMSRWCLKCKVDIWAYCLMPNHTHLIAVPSSEEGLRRAIGEAHRRYTRMVNFREGWRGHLWQGRFFSFPMDNRHLYFSARYVELNPVRSGLIKKPGSYPWSSARAHIFGFDDGLVKARPLLDFFGNWEKLLARPLKEKSIEKIRLHERTGRPLGTKKFARTLENLLHRVLTPRKPGPKSLKQNN